MTKQNSTQRFKNHLHNVTFKRVLCSVKTQSYGLVASVFKQNERESLLLGDPLLSNTMKRYSVKALCYRKVTCIPSKGSVNLRILSKYDYNF